MGRVPEWYPLIQTAKYLGVAPWDLARQPNIWLAWGQKAHAAETDAERQLRERPIPPNE